jgi:hypothetical protein
MLSNTDIVMEPGFKAQMKAESIIKSEVKKTIKHPDCWQRLKVAVPEEVRNSLSRDNVVPRGSHHEIPNELEQPIILFMRLIKSSDTTADYWLLVQCRLREPKAKAPKTDPKQSPGNRERNPYAPSDRPGIIVVTAWRLYRDEFGDQEFSSPIDAMRAFCEVFGIEFILENEPTSLAVARLVRSEINKDTLFPAHRYLYRQIHTSQQTWNHSTSRSLNKADGTGTVLSHTHASASLLWLVLAYCIDLKRYHSYLLRHGVHTAMLEKFVDKEDVA